MLSGVTYLLGMNPEALARLTKEVRSAFGKEEAITFTSVNGLQYMQACLDEALRMYPPVPTGLPRVVPKGGYAIAGQFVPERVSTHSPEDVGAHDSPRWQTYVSQFHYALYHHEKFFNKANEFHPERWLGDPRFATDDRDLFQPFRPEELHRQKVSRDPWHEERRLVHKALTGDGAASRTSKCEPSSPVRCGTLTSSWRGTAGTGSVNRRSTCSGRSIR